MTYYSEFNEKLLVEWHFILIHQCMLLLVLYIGNRNDNEVNRNDK